MEDKISKYELLLIKDMEGELSPEEKQELDEWFREPQNQTLFNQQKKLWASTDELRKMKTIDKKRALRKVENRLFGRFAINRLRTFERVAAILFIPLLLSSLWIFYNSYSSVRTENRTVYNTVEIPLGTRSSMTLPDGTSVWLNAGSSLKYPVTFEENERRVQLLGEAYFEVKKDKHRPFIVSASDVNIRVLGTSFNCSAYSNNSEIETALVEGKVEIFGKKGKNSFVLKPGELAVYSKPGRTIEKRPGNLDKYIAWKSGRLMFRDDPMSKVIEKLGRWYSVEFQVDNPEILAYTYSATFLSESLDQVLKMLALSAPINFEFLPREKKGEADYGIQIIKLTKK